MRQRFLKTAALCAIGAGAAYTNVVAAPIRKQHEEPRAYEGLYYMICGTRKPVSGPEEKKRILLAKFEFCKGR